MEYSDYVDAVLEFWFAGDESVNYKTKWFPSGSAELQISADNLVVTKFETIFEKAACGELDAWKTMNNSPRAIVALIIILDQFSRHIFRHRGLPPTDPKRANVDSLALACAEEYILKYPNWDERSSMAEIVFVLMPFRHSATVDRLEFVLSRINKHEIMLNNGAALMDKFKKQTVRRLQHLQDRVKATLNDDVLDFQGFETDTLLDEQIRQHPLYATTKKFLLKHSKHANNTLAVSLSGGVDSMVIAKVLTIIRNQHNECIGDTGTSSPINIVAIHVDYANRDESGKEAAFLEEWCLKNHIDFHKRVINEATRGITERNQYEIITREIRYNFYLMVMSQINGVDINGGIHGIIFGHHMGDVEENVISNIMRGSSPLLLSGMGETSVIHNVPVWRPLLVHSKDQIYEFAHKFGVPYFKDTTPSWSTRGKLRNQLIPLLREMYGTGCTANLRQLAYMSDELNVMVQANIYQPIMNSVKIHPTGIEVNLLPFIGAAHATNSFWKEVLKQIMHSMGMSMIRERSIINFVDRIQRFNSANGPCDKVLGGWLELRKGFHSYLTDSAVLIIFKVDVMLEILNTGGGDKVVNAVLKASEQCNMTERILPLLDGTSRIIEYYLSDGVSDDSRLVLDSKMYSSQVISNNSMRSISKVPTSICICMPESFMLSASEQNNVLKIVEVQDWRIEIEVSSLFTNQSNKGGAFVDNGIFSLLRGEFYYQFENIPLALCKSFYVLSNILPSQTKLINKHCSKLLSPFQKLDSKVRLGLPLLIPLHDFELNISSGSNNCIRKAVTLHYTYIGCASSHVY